MLLMSSGRTVHCGMEENIHKVSFSAILIKTERITGRSGSPSAFIISETSEQVSIKFCIATLH
jgi:hypothetical protein